MELPSLVSCLPLFVLHVRDGALCTPLQSIAVLEFGTSYPLTDSFRDAECLLCLYVTLHTCKSFSSLPFFAFPAIFPTTPQQHPLLPTPSAPNLCVPPGLIGTSAVRCLLLLPLPSLSPAALQMQLSTHGLCGPLHLLLPPSALLCGLWCFDCLVTDLFARCVYFLPMR